MPCADSVQTVAHGRLRVMHRCERALQVAQRTWPLACPTSAGPCHVGHSTTKGKLQMGRWSGLIVTSSGGVDTLTLDRADKLNAIDPPMAEDLARYFREKANDPACRVIAIRGAGRGFCAGVDLTTLDAPEDERWGSAGVRKELAIQAVNRQFILEMRRCPQPIVALVHGVACGAGFALALASDIRIAARNARMNCAFIGVGLGGCDIGVSYFLPRLIGASVAAELILTGRFLGAERAMTLGLFSSLVDDADALGEACKAITDDLLRVSPIALRLSKQALRFAIDAPSLDAVIAMEDRNQVLCARTADFQQAIRAFRGKQPADWLDA